MSEHIARLQNRIRKEGMNKVASAIAAMPPRQRLLTRMCMTKNAGLLDSLINWASAHPELASAVAVGAPTAALAAAAAKKNKLSNALMFGGGAGILGAAGGSIFRNWDKVKAQFGKKAPAAPPAPAPKTEETSANTGTTGKKDVVTDKDVTADQNRPGNS